MIWKLFIFSYILFLSNESVYSDFECRNSSDRFSIDLRNDPNGSLKNFKTQDQDGLGTCYSNSMSVMLQSWTGRPVSYHQLATAFGLDRLSGNQTKNNRGDFFTEGGNSCQAFEALKKRNQKLCQSKDVLFENLIFSDYQEVFLKKIGDFYEALNNLKGQDAKNIITHIKNASANAKKGRVEECRNQIKLEHEAKKGLTFFIQNLYDNLKFSHQAYLNDNEFSDPDNPNVEKFENLQSTANQIGNYKKNQEGTEEHFSLTDNLEQKVQEILGEIKKNKMPLDTPDQKKQFYSWLMNKIVGESNSAKPFVFIESFFDLNHFLVEPILSFTNFDYCMTKQHGKIFKNYLKQNKECLIGVDPKIYDFLDQANKILFHNSENIELTDSFYDHLSDSPESAENFFMGLFGKGCEKNGISIPQDAECHKVTFPERLNFFQKAFKSNDEIERLEKQKTLKLLNAIVSKDLTATIKGSPLQGRAVVVDVCLGFMKNDNANFNWPKNPEEKNCKYNGKHTFHSMAIIGMRCFQGKIQYKIQNSWGKGCPVEATSSIKKNCDSKEGSFWLDENILAENVTGISVMSRDKAHYGESF